MAEYVPIQIEKDGQVKSVLIPKDIYALISAPDCDPEMKCSVMREITSQLCIDGEQKPEQKDPATFDNTDDNNNNQLTTVDAQDNNLSTRQSMCATPSPQPTSSQVHVWSENEEKCLIQLRLSLEEDFGKAKNHDRLWVKICNELNKQGVTVTKVQTMNKFKAMKKRYKEVLDANNKTGNNRIDWKLLSLFDEQYGHKASTCPQAQFDSGLEDQQKAKKVKKSPCKSRKRQANTMLNKVSEMNENLLHEIQSHHADKMQRLDRFLDMFEKSIDTKKPDNE